MSITYETCERKKFTRIPKIFIFRRRRIGRGRSIPWPSRSLDLKASDFLFSGLSQKAYEISNSRRVKDVIVASFNELPVDICQKCTSHLNVDYNVVWSQVDSKYPSIYCKFFQDSKSVISFVLALTVIEI
jgi:hypothetical protein